MISAKTWYKTHDNELWAIIEAFKTWRHYLKSCKYEVLDLTDCNNLCQFIDMKGLSSIQVRWAQKLFRYHFSIHYNQNKANRAVNTLSQYLQQIAKEEETFRAKNLKIFYHL